MTTRRARLLWAVLNATGLLFALICNGLANALPLNGMDTGELSALYPNLFVPVGTTFSIWGVIYLWLLALVGYGLTRVGDDGTDNPLARIGPWFLVNTLANGAWIFAWHWRLVPLSLLVMLVILGSLVAMYLRLGIGRADDRPPAERWTVHAAVQVYLGWITVATIANITTLAVDLGAPAFGTGPAVLTVAVMATAVALAGAMLWTRRDRLFAAVVAWALLGIWLKRSAAPEDGSGLVAVAALVGLAAVGLALVGLALVGLRAGGALRKRR